MLEISVRFHSTLKRHVQTADGTVTYWVKAGTTIGEVLSKAGVIPGEVAIIRLNGKIVEEGEPIVQQSVIEVFPIFGGG